MAMFLLRLVCKLYNPVSDDLRRHDFMTSVLPTQTVFSVIVCLVETTFSKGDKQVSVFIDLSDHSTFLNLNDFLPSTFTSLSCMHLSQNNVIRLPFGWLAHLLLPVLSLMTLQHPIFFGLFHWQLLLFLCCFSIYSVRGQPGPKSLRLTCSGVSF